MTTLVFKFRDDLLPKPDSAWLRLLKLPEAYFEQAAAFASQAKAKTTLVGWLLSKLPFSGLKTLMKNVREKSQTSPYSPFGDAGYEKLSRLAERARQHNVAKSISLPNLFNYFQIDFPEGTSEPVIQLILGLFEAFLPHRAWLGFYLFDYVYLKSDPVPLGALTPQDALGGTTNAGQFYFTDMMIPPTGNVPPGITIVEADGWDLTHAQFAALTPQPTIVPIETNPFSVATLAPVSGKLDHGTQILGVLAAADTNADNGAAPAGDLCRGIVPRLTVRLVSCLAKGSELDSSQHFRTIRYNELAAVLTAIDVTPSGETILIELGTAGGRFPLDIQPAIYELLTFAHALQITVVAAAGNESSVLNTVPPGGADDPLMPRDIRKAAVKGELDNHSRTHWNAYTNKANRKRIDDLYKRLMGRAGTAGSEWDACKFTSVDQFLTYYQETPSPAILVGAASRAAAAAPGQPVRFSLLPNSSRGDRVRVFAQGSGILTTTINQQFTADMSNTSGAAAIIAGLVVLLQQKAKSKNQPVLNPATVRDWLAEAANGSPVKTEQGTTTGVVPWCDKLLAHV